MKANITQVTYCRTPNPAGKAKVTQVAYCQEFRSRKEGQRVAKVTQVTYCRKVRARQESHSGASHVLSRVASLP